MPKEILQSITCPADLKRLSKEELAQLTQEIREKIIYTTSISGGHLAPSLGVVELTLGIHLALDTPHDKLIFDVGHQSYVHKLITGRCEAFDTLRSYGGLSGFTKRRESEYDVNDSGHASDSLSIALGLALARDERAEKEEIVAVIGDGSMTGGMAFEALNYIGHIETDITVVLNDNEMSISPNVGAIAGYLGKIRLDPRYVKLRDTIESRIIGTGKIGKFMVDAGEAAKESFKQLVIPGMLFEELGIKYVGPIDGHDIEAVRDAVLKAKRFSGPVLIHAITRKGAGYAPAELHPDSFHGVGKFDVETGEIISSGGGPSYTAVFADALIREAHEDPRIAAITAAMPAGTGLDRFGSEFPDRIYDVGIAEENAVGMATGLALGGQLPVVAIYSTFLQRAYDQLIVNAALQKQHIVFCLDRAGLVGEDGPTHHGVFDIAYLRLIPNMRIIAPSSGEELADALHTALREPDGPIAIRYPRGSAFGGAPTSDVRTKWDVGKSVLRREGDDVEILAVGRMVGVALEVADLLALQGISVAVRDMRWIKPFDVEAVSAALASDRLVVTIEDGVKTGGFGSAVLEEANELGAPSPILTLALPDRFIDHGSTDFLLNDLGLDAAGISASITEALKNKGKSTRSHES